MGQKRRQCLLIENPHTALLFRSDILYPPSSVKKNWRHGIDFFPALIQQIS